MKYVKDGELYDIISNIDNVYVKNGEDIGKSLSNIIDKHTKDINTLKQGMKYLTMHGGMGGSGGGSGSGGSGSSKMNIKSKLTLKYITTDGHVVTEEVGTGVIKDYTIQKYSKVDIIIEDITSGARESTHYLSLNESATGVIKNSELTLGKPAYAYSTTIKENNVINITLRNTQKSLTYTLRFYTDIMSIETYIDNKTYNIKNGENINSVNNYFVFKIKNNNPTVYKNVDINEIKIFGIDRDNPHILYKDTDFKTITIADDKNGIETTYLVNCEYQDGDKLSLPTSKLITENSFGIYDICVKYNFAEETNKEENLTFIYYDNTKPFVYLYSNVLQVYNGETESFEAYSGNIFTFLFRIYKEENYQSGRTYEFNAKFYLYNNSNKKYELYDRYTTNLHKLNQGVDYNFSLKNEIESYGTNDNRDCRLKIEITLDGNENNKMFYYTYVKPAQKPDYIFTKDKLYNFYAAINAHTDDTNTINTNQFKIVDGYYVGDNVSHSIKYLLSNTKVAEYESWQPISVSGNLNDTAKFSTIYDFVASSDRGDASDMKDGNFDTLLSFGVRYHSDIQSVPILTIADNYDLYKTKLRNNNNSTDISETINCFSIPNGTTQNDFHLITFYIKSHYNATPDLLTNNVLFGDKDKYSCLLFVDGVINSKPFDFTNINLNTTIQLNKGDWEFNFIGITFFNPHIINEYNIMDGNIPIVKHNKRIIARYLQDFDPFIVSNYYDQWQRHHLTDDVVKNGIFDGNIYKESTLNYLTNDDVNETKILNKFIKIKPTYISQMLGDDEMDIYLIKPTKSTPKPNSFEKLHPFVYNTLESYNEEDSRIETGGEGVTKGVLQKWKWDTNGTGKFVDVIPSVMLKDGDITSSVTPQFTFRFQGSSTLLYSSKNFEVSVDDIRDDNDNTNYSVYFTPDSGLFSIDNVFNFKADVVDSSHSNNIVIGDFVNKVMESPYSTEKKSALVGKQVLLFINNNCVKDINDGDQEDYIFLGIYSLNLSRKSKNNMGYISMPEEINKTTNSDDSKIEYAVIDSSKIAIPADLHIAEIQGNNILFDFSQVDDGMLSETMLGDFVNSSGSLYNATYSKPFDWLRSYIFKIFGFNNDGSGGIFPTINFENIFTGAEQPDGGTEEFVGISGFELKQGTTITDYKIYHDGQLKNIGDLEDYIKGGKVISANEIDKLPVYKSLHNGIPYIIHPMLQFHLLYDNDGHPYKDESKGYIYLAYKQPYITNINYYNSDEYQTGVERFDIDSSLLYYIICMALGMVDSVQKNVTIKRSGNKWYPAFYDMDTAFRLNNSGQTIDFRAFSAYIKDNKIINDYAPLHHDGLGWFDVPSSYLFMFAKYAAYLDPTLNNNDPDNIPFKQYNRWVSMRTDGTGELRSAQYFHDEYISKKMRKAHPLIWNLNYMYKYFSMSNNLNKTDTEISKFNGDGKYIRTEWLNDRLHFLDIMFGVLNQQNIGSSNVRMGSTETPTSTSDIVIAESMFPSFTKGVNPQETYIEFTTPTNTPFIYRIDDSNTRIWISGTDGIISQTIPSGTNTNVAFYGSKEITSFNSGMGAFLINNGSTVTNTIINNNIKNIDINILTNISLEINEDTPLVETINIYKQQGKEQNLKNLTIGKKSFSQNDERLNYETITISTQGGALSVDVLTIKNANIETLDLGSLTIKTALNLNNCVIKNLKTSGTSGGSISRNCIPTTITMEGGVNIEKINDKTLTTFTINSNTLKEISCNNIGFNVTLESSVKIEKVSIKNITDKTFIVKNIYYLRNDGISISNVSHTPNSYISFISPNITSNFVENSIYNNQNITSIGITSCYNRLNLTLAGFEKLETLSIECTPSGSDKAEIHLKDSCFRHNVNLKEIKVNNVNIMDENTTPNNKEFKICVDGPRVFFNCISLNANRIVDWVDFSGTTGFNHMFFYQENRGGETYLKNRLTEDSFVKFVGNYKDKFTTPSFGCDAMFFGANLYTGDINDITKIKTHIDGLTTQLKEKLTYKNDKNENEIKKITANMSRALVRTGLCMMTKEFVSLFGDTYDSLLVASKYNDTQTYMYVEDGVIGHFKYFRTSDGSSRPVIKFFNVDDNGNIELLVGSNSSGHKSITMTDIFGDNTGGITSIIDLNIYTDEYTSINFNDGLPNTLRNLTLFGGYAARTMYVDYYNYLGDNRGGFLNIFKNFTGENSITIRNLFQNIYLYKTIYDEENNPTSNINCTNSDYKASDYCGVDFYKLFMKDSETMYNVIFNMDKNDEYSQWRFCKFIDNYGSISSVDKFRTLFGRILNQTSSGSKGNLRDMFRNCVVFVGDSNPENILTGIIHQNDDTSFVNVNLNLSNTFNNFVVYNDSEDKTIYLDTVHIFNKTHRGEVIMESTFANSYSKSINGVFNTLDGKITSMYSLYENTYFENESETGIITQTNSDTQNLKILTFDGLSATPTEEVVFEENIQVAPYLCAKEFDSIPENVKSFGDLLNCKMTTDGEYDIVDNEGINHSYRFENGYWFYDRSITREVYREKLILPEDFFLKKSQTGSCDRILYNNSITEDYDSTKMNTTMMGQLPQSSWKNFVPNAQSPFVGCRIMPRYKRLLRKFTNSDFQVVNCDLGAVNILSVDGVIIDKSTVFRYDDNIKEIKKCYINFSKIQDTTQYSSELVDGENSKFNIEGIPNTIEFYNLTHNEYILYRVNKGNNEYDYYYSTKRKMRGYVDTIGDTDFDVYCVNCNDIHCWVYRGPKYFSENSIKDYSEDAPYIFPEWYMKNVSSKDKYFVYIPCDANPKTLSLFESDITFTQPLYKFPVIPGFSLNSGITFYEIIENLLATNSSIQGFNINFYVDKNKEQKIKVQSNNLLRYGSDYLFPNKINNILIYLLNVDSNMIYGSYNGAVFIPEFTSVNNVNMSELYNHGNKFNSNYIH